MAERPAVWRCGGCGTELAPGFLVCPACQRLVYAEELQRCASTAETAQAAGDTGTALTAWRQALALLPPESRQYQAVLTKVQELSVAVGRLPRGPRPTLPVADGRKRGAWTALAVTVGLGLWKFKFLLGMILTKGKLLLLGLTKASTFFSMILSLGVYWAAWGWKFALGVVLSMYVHEMGHVYALRRYGMPASAPMFVPGLGAFVRLRQAPTSPREDARIGLAGPLWGLAAAVVAYGVFWATGWASWAAIAKVGAWINLFNLLPVWQLDGGRGFHALTRSQRWTAVAVLAGAWYFSAEGLLVLLLLVAVMRALGPVQTEEPDRTALAQYVVLVAALTALSQVAVPGLGMP
jgi:Zn-dependent protease